MKKWIAAGDLRSFPLVGSKQVRREQAPVAWVTFFKPARVFCFGFTNCFLLSRGWEVIKAQLT